jgi:hypothetical protein
MLSERLGAFPICAMAQQLLVCLWASYNKGPRVFMDTEVFTIEAAPVSGIVFDTIIFSVFVPIVAGIIGCVAILNAIDSKVRLKAAIQ